MPGGSWVSGAMVAGLWRGRQLQIHWDSPPFAVGTPSGPFVLVLMGWTLRCRPDVWPQVCGLLTALFSWIHLCLPLAKL